MNAVVDSLPIAWLRRVGAMSLFFVQVLARVTDEVLAALGLNTFFSGDSAGNLQLNELVLEDPARFAASRTACRALP